MALEQLPCGCRVKNLSNPTMAISACIHVSGRRQHDGQVGQQAALLFCGCSTPGQLLSCKLLIQQSYTWCPAANRSELRRSNAIYRIVMELSLSHSRQPHTCSYFPSGHITHVFNDVKCTAGCAMATACSNYKAAGRLQTDTARTLSSTAVQWATC